MFSLSNLSF